MESQHSDNLQKIRFYIDMLCKKHRVQEEVREKLYWQRAFDFNICEDGEIRHSGNDKTLEEFVLNSKPVPSDEELRLGRKEEIYQKLIKLSEQGKMDEYRVLRAEYSQL